jgi:transposase-like protein
MVCGIGGKRMYLWRAVADEGEALDLVVRGRRDTEAALKLLKRLLHNQPVEPETLTTDGLLSYIPHHPRGDLQHLQHPAPSDQQTHTSPLLRRGDVRLGRRCCLISGRVGLA